MICIDEMNVGRLMMMAMVTNISWNSYFAAIIVLLCIWYLILILKFYSTHLKKIISGEKAITIPLLNKANKSLLFDKSPQKSNASAISESYDTLEDAQELTLRIVRGIAEILERNLSREECKNYLKMILEEYPYVKISSLRDNITKIIVSECEKHLPFILSYAEADDLWEETI
ncbi:hypothetical protein [Flavobacterium luteolum]|uniref:hypothetical protein n=1 Tax=Flavobacterium luteolum TaxID=3003259 RepID=UPI00248E9C46|nr:hypothetical protein [Flavobacterium luteolum]